MQLDKTKQELLLRKICRRRDEIKSYLFSNHTPISNIIYRETRDYETLEQALSASDYRPIQPGDQWGGGKNGWFRMNIVVPQEWKGETVSAFLRLATEALVYINGKPYHGIDRFHEEVPLLDKAKGGESFEVVIDAISGLPWDPDPTRPENAGSILARAELATRNNEVWKYWFDLEVLYTLAEQLPPDSPRRAKLIYGINKSVDAFDYDDTSRESLKQSTLKADEFLKPLLDCPASTSAMEFACVGHSHIDTAWKWPYKETRRKCGRTFSTVLQIMERYPEFVFSQGQAQLYEFVKDNHPYLYEQIKRHIKEGRWEVTGSMWVEADCNLTSGESIIRQILHGKNFYREEFRIDTDVLWLPDVFGYSAALPQILEKSGIKYFATNKIHWNDTNKPPYGTFHWKGIDGSRVLTHFPPSLNYNGFPAAEWFYRYERDFPSKGKTDKIIFTYGWGDGGGGPENRHIEYLRRSENLEGLPRCVNKSIGRFFHKIDDGTDYDEWSGELYLEYHRGTYTNQGKIKRQNRKAEYLYHDAELLSCIAESFDLPYPKEELNRECKKILTNQFHDVIPGTSVRQVYEDTDRMYEEVFNTGRSIIANAMGKLSKEIDTSDGECAVLAFNSLSWEHKGLVRAHLPGEADYALLDPDGNEIPYQKTDSTEIIFTATVPPMGYTVYKFVKKAPVKPENDIKVSINNIENRFYKIRLDSDGTISSITEKITGRELIPQGKKANLLQLFEDKPYTYPAWELDFYHEDKYRDVTELDAINVVENGPVRAAIEVTRTFSKSKLAQRIVVYSDIPRIDFETNVDWHEKEKLLKVAFPIDINTSKARYEIQFGNVERATHRNTSWDFARFEVPAQKWADISEEGFGISLMNDCKYGYSVKGDTMRLSLLRSQKKPDSEADMGMHQFTYSILPHPGSYVKAEIVRRAYELNVPLISIFTGSHKGKLPGKMSFITLDADNVILETVKNAEKEDSIILRFYECHNKRAKVTINVNILPFREVYECNLMEENIGKIDTNGKSFILEIKPFEIKTVKLV